MCICIVFLTPCVSNCLFIISRCFTNSLLNIANRTTNPKMDNRAEHITYNKDVHVTEGGRTARIPFQGIPFGLRDRSGTWYCLVMRLQVFLVFVLIFEHDFISQYGPLLTSKVRVPTVHSFSLEENNTQKRKIVIIHHRSKHKIQHTCAINYLFNTLKVAQSNYSASLLFVVKREKSIY